MKLTEDIREALAAATTDGNLLHLHGQLDPDLYQRVDAALQAAGGRWNKGRKAHVFPFLAAPALAALQAETEVTTAGEAKQQAQFFATPPDVVADLIRYAGLGPDHEVLEPSAGDGAIAAAVAELGVAVDCIELDPWRAGQLERAGRYRTVRCADFLHAQPAPAYDRVIMNPPFTRGQDVKHVRHALRFVKRGGRLIAVMSPAITSRGDKATRTLRAQIEEWGGWFEEMEAGAFAESGTPVATVIAVVPVPGGPDFAVMLPDGGGQAWRVTTDYTDHQARLFHAATAKSGIYIRYDGWRGRDVVFRFAGNCVGCSAPTWAHDDGPDDVRGPFGFNTCCALTAEDFDPGQVPDDARFPQCGECWNDRKRHEHARRQALARFAAAPVVVPIPRPVPAGPAVQASLFDEEPAA